MNTGFVDAAAALVDRLRALELETAQSPALEPFVADVHKALVAATNLQQIARTAAADRPDAGPLSRIARHDLLNAANQVIGYGEMLHEEAMDRDLAGFDAGLAGVLASARSLAHAIDAGGAGHAAPTIEASPASGTAAPSSRWAFPQPLLRSANPVLVVDDDEANRDVLSAFMRRHGVKVVEAVDGLAALDILQREPIDLVLLDVLMPNLDGFGVLERMHANPALKSVPVLMVSGLSELDSVVRCIEMGAADYLPKPFNPVLLRARISACLEKKALHDQEKRTLQALEQSQAQLAAEIAQAERYVRSLLPPPVTGAIAIDWRFYPSTHLGGDALGYQWLDADHLSMYVLDVCGHGVGAALLSVSVANQLRTEALPATDFLEPAQVLAALNEAFQMDRHDGQYFTMWYGVYNQRTRQLRHASGGHPPAILLSPGESGPTVTRLGQSGLIIGAMTEATYTSDVVDVPRGARLFVFSDGAYEVARPDGTMVSWSDFEQILAGVTSDGAPPLDQVIGALERASGSSEFADDVSVMEVVFRA